MIRCIAFIFLLMGLAYHARSQCTALRQQRNLTFNTDKDCAPVTVTDFTITYFFNVPQEPAEISILFEWNDPGNNIDLYSQGDPEFSVGGGDLEFTSSGTFVYPENDACLFTPSSYILVDGVVCETSEQIQVVSSWSDDNDFGGQLGMDPDPYRVCYNNPILNAVLEDNSVFNCNINDESDNPNRMVRHTQFVYGINHDPSNSIRNLTLEDGGTISITDGNANLTSTTTRNGVTGAYFGPIVEVPFPADGPNMETFPMNAPANPANAVGSEFEVTLFNWNTCNPYNGDALNPNYNEAVSTNAFIRIVDPPDPDFQTRQTDASGIIQTVFCIGETIYFENLTVGGYDYTWEFYDDDSGIDLLSTSNNDNPTFAFDNFGDKLVRLSADDQNAQGICMVMVDYVLSISPATMAGIELFDPSFSNQITPVFCQPDGTEIFTVGFRDATTNIEPSTEWRWEFFDETGAFAESIPAIGFGGQVTDFTRDYSSQGEYLVRLISRNNTSNCESIDEKTISVYSSPESSFAASEICEGERTRFEGIADSLNGIVPQIDNDYIDLYEWDFSYDGNFNAELTRTDSSSFEWYLDGQAVMGGAEPLTSAAGTYQVALRVTTINGQCTDLHVQEVPVHPLPDPLLASDYTEPICPGDSVTVFNNSMLTAGVNYWLIVTDGIATDTIPFNRTDSLFSYSNTTGVEKTFTLLLYGETMMGCLDYSDDIEIRVLPIFPSAFEDPNYDPFGSNCSVWASTLLVDAATQLLDPETFTWTMYDQNGILDGYPITKNTGDPDFYQLDYAIENSTQTNQRYRVNLDVVKTGICVESSQWDLMINPNPTADFDVVETDSCEYKLFELEAAQKGLPIYDWGFSPEPDQWVNNGEIQQVMYLRPADGNTDLNPLFTLTTENLVNCRSDEVQYTGVVAAGEPAIAIGFSLDRDTLRLPDDNILSIFNDSNSEPGWEFRWDFGDGTLSSQENPVSHQYNEPGSFQVTLTVENSYCQESLNRTVFVMSTAPMVDFSADPLSGCRPLTVSFTNLSESTDQLTYLWDFGDGNSSTAVNPVHVFSSSGTYTISLYAESSTGVSATEIKESYIEVLPSPLADFVANPTTVLIPDQTVYFRNQSINSTRYYWDFGDGNTSQEVNPTHNYTDEGQYDITLIAENELGCSDTLLLQEAVVAVKGGTVKVPNAFSPSPDGSGSANAINDVFIPRVEGVSDFRMLIYNRWGELLFESYNQQTGWNGYYKGMLMPADVYVFRLELTFSDGRELVRIGDVTLLR